MDLSVKSACLQFIAKPSLAWRLVVALFMMMMTRLRIPNYTTLACKQKESIGITDDGNILRASISTIPKNFPYKIPVPDAL